MSSNNAATGTASRAAAIACLSILTGCGQQAVSMCEPVPTSAEMTMVAKFGGPPLESIKRAKACLHYQAYRLAKVDADPRTLADAVLAACDLTVSDARVNSWVASFNSHSEGGLPPGFQSLAADGSEGPPCAGTSCELQKWDQKAVAVEADRIANEVVSDLRQAALFRVVEGKAGNCPAPPQLKMTVPAERVAN